MFLRQQTAIAVFWMALTALLSYALYFGTTALLARLLHPAAFGVVAMALIVINVMEMVRDMGFGQALIHYQGDIKKAADTAFFLILSAGFFVAFITALSAPLIARFFGEESLTPIVRILSLSMIISSISRVHYNLLEKELQFKRKFLPEVMPLAGYAAIAIPAAFFGAGAWSLVLGHITKTALLSFLIWMVCWWRPSFSFDKEVAKRLFSYGKHIFAVLLLSFFATNMDQALVGKILGSAALGFYALSFTIANLPATKIVHVVGRVLFPAYAKIQNNPHSLKRSFLEVTNYVLLFSSALAFFFFCLAEEFVLTFFGKKWAPMIPAFQILSFYGLLRAFNANCGIFLNATGYPRIVRDIIIVSIIVFLLFVWPVAKIAGIVGVAALSTFGSLLFASFLMMKNIRRHLSLDNLQLLSILKPLTPSILSACIIFFIKPFFNEGLFSFVVLSICFLCLFSLFLFLFHRPLIRETFLLFHNLLKNNKNFAKV